MSKGRKNRMSKKQKLNTLDQAIKNAFHVRDSSGMSVEDALRLQNAIEAMCEVYRNIKK